MLVLYVRVSVLIFFQVHAVVRFRSVSHDVMFVRRFLREGKCVVLTACRGCDEMIIMTISFCERHVCIL